MEMAIQHSTNEGPPTQCLCYLSVVPRHTMFYDIVDYLYSHRISDRLRAEVPLLMVRPINQAIQRQHIKIVSQFR